MTRRNLSDILRQEVKKETSETSEPDSKPVALETPETSVAAAASSSRARKSTATASSSADSATADDASEAKFTAQITELKAALAQGAEHEKTLQAEVKSLQADVKRQQKEAGEAGGLEAQVARLKTELTEAKDLILQLSEENTQMRKTVDELKAPKAQSQRKAPLSLRSLPSHSVQPSSTTKKPKSVDVGWMD